MSNPWQVTGEPPYQFSRDLKLAALEQACVSEPDDPPTQMSMAPSLYHHLRNLDIVTPPIARPNDPPFKVAVTVVDEDALPYEVVEISGYRDPHKIRWVELDGSRVHSSRVCMGGVESTGCHDGSVYGPCGTENCYGQDTYEGPCGCVCHG